MTNLEREREREREIRGETEGGRREREGEEGRELGCEREKER